MSLFAIRGVRERIGDRSFVALRESRNGYSLLMSVEAVICPVCRELHLRLANGRMSVHNTGAGVRCVGSLLGAAPGTKPAG